MLFFKCSICPKLNNICLQHFIKLDEVDYIKYLGVTNEENFTLKEQIEN